MVIFTMEDGRALQGPVLPEAFHEIDVVTNSAELPGVSKNRAE